MRPRGLLFSAKSAAKPPNPGHAPEAAPRKILQIFRGDPDFANRKLKKRRCNMQNNRRKFSITAAGWAAYESLRALVAARRTSPQLSVSRELSACTPCGSFSRRKKMQGVRRAPRSCRNYRATHSFLLRRIFEWRCFVVRPHGLLFSAKSAAKPPNPGYVMTKVDVRGCAAVRDSLIKSRWGRGGRMAGFSYERGGEGCNFWRKGLLSKGGRI